MVPELVRQSVRHDVRRSQRDVAARRFGAVRSGVASQRAVAHGHADQVALAPAYQRQCCMVPRLPLAADKGQAFGQPAVIERTEQAAFTGFEPGSCLDDRLQRLRPPI